MQGQDQKPDIVRDAKHVGGVGVFLLHCASAPHRACFNVLGTWGYRVPFSLPSLVGMLLPWLVAAVWGPSPGAEIMFYWWWGILALYIIHRLSTSRALRKGKKIHSHFVGQSIFSRMFPRLDVSTTQGLMEMIAAILIGAVLLEYCPPLAISIGLMGIANVAALCLLAARDDRVLEEALNQELTGRYYAERLKERMGEEE